MFDKKFTKASKKQRKKAKKTFGVFKTKNYYNEFVKVSKGVSVAVFGNFHKIKMNRRSMIQMVANKFSTGRRRRRNLFLSPFQTGNKKEGQTDKLLVASMHEYSEMDTKNRTVCF